MEEYVCLNGEYIKISQAKLSVRNRALYYGDALFETIHANGTVPQFLEKHYNRLIHGMKVLNMSIPEYFTLEYLFKKIQGILVRNKYFKGARVRLTIYRNEGGLYTPENNDISFIIDTTKLDHYKYILNEKGYFVDIFPDIKKPINKISSLKSANSLIFVLAGIYRKNKNLDDCIILNEKGYLCESISSNIFLVKNKKLYTPPLKDGCIPGIMREVLIELLQKNGFYISEQQSLTVNDILDADEFFLTNAINGIRWVLGFKKRRFFNIISNEICNLLNKEYIPD